MRVREKRRSRRREYDKRLWEQTKENKEGEKNEKASRRVEGEEL